MIRYIIKNTILTKKYCDKWDDHNLQILYFKAMYNRDGINGRVDTCFDQYDKKDFYR